MVCTNLKPACIWGFCFDIEVIPFSLQFRLDYHFFCFIKLEVNLINLLLIYTGSGSLTIKFRSSTIVNFWYIYYLCSSSPRKCEIFDRKYEVPTIFCFFYAFADRRQGSLSFTHVGMYVPHLVIAQYLNIFYDINCCHLFYFWE